MYVELSYFVRPGSVSMKRGRELWDKMCGSEPFITLSVLLRSSAGQRELEVTKGLRVSHSVLKMGKDDLL